MNGTFRCQAQASSTISVLDSKSLDPKKETITLIMSLTGSGINIFSLSVTLCQGHSVVVSPLDSEGRWFKAQSMPWCCFLRQETLPHIVSLHPGVYNG